MLRDMASNIKWLMAEPPQAAVTNDTAFVSEIVDTANFGSVTFLGLHGTNADTDATYTILVEDGNDSSLTDAAAVDDAFLVGVEAMGLGADDDNKAFKIGYIGPKQYVRVTITPVNNTGNAFIAGGWLLGPPMRKSPQSDQVV